MFGGGGDVKLSNSPEAGLKTPESGLNASRFPKIESSSLDVGLLDLCTIPSAGRCVKQARLLNHDIAILKVCFGCCFVGVVIDPFKLRLRRV